jgi:hypothetical protein
MSVTVAADFGATPGTITAIPDAGGTLIGLQYQVGGQTYATAETPESIRAIAATLNVQAGRVAFTVDNPDARWSVSMTNQAAKALARALSALVP